MPEQDVQSKFNVMLTSGDVPEIIFGVLEPSQILLYGSTRLFLPLNDMIERQAPRLMRAFEIYPDLRNSITGPDGNIYSMVGVEDCYHCSMSQKLWIYEPWLDELGLEMPQTTAEYEQVLKAFKEEDPSGNGKADEIPLSTSPSPDAWQGTFDAFFMNSFLGPEAYNPNNPWLILQDGTITPVYNKPGWRDSSISADSTPTA